MTKTPLIKKTAKQRSFRVKDKSKMQSLRPRVDDPFLVIFVYLSLEKSIICERSISDHVSTHTAQVRFGVFGSRVGKLKIFFFVIIESVFFVDGDILAGVEERLGRIS